MPARLLYQPKAYVYTKDQSGKTYNLTNYVVSGQVNRVIDQVSSATITLQNPYKRFTTPQTKGGVAFHPMDPITIYLERLKGFPVRVFTGYLDTTPYYQMFPGTITLKASCTLKRLLYTYFDPSLPFVIAFFGKYGWVNTGQGSIINPSAFGGQPKDTTQINDSSIGKLLWATLYEIGDWRDTNIFVESIPDGIMQRMAQLMSSIEKSQKAASSEFTTFLKNVVGNGSQGSGAGSPTATGTGHLASGAGLTIGGSAIDSTQLANLNTSLDIASGMGASQLVMQAMVFAGIAENKWYDTTSPSNPTHQGVFQSTAFPAGQLAAATKAWLTGGPSFGGGGGIQYVKNHPNASLQEIASTVEVSGNQYLSESGYSNFAPEAIAIVKAYLAGGSTGSGVGQVAGSKSATSSAGSVLNQVGSTAGAAANAGLITIANMFPDGALPNRIDEGVDYNPKGGQGRVCAIADSDILSYSPGAYDGNLLVLRFKDAPLSQGGCGSGQWYLAEVFTPAKTTGSVKAGEVIGTMTGHIEVGWWSGSGSCGTPQVPGRDSGGLQTSAWGTDFNNLIVASGGPAGVTENPPVGGTPINDWKGVLAGKANFIGSGGASTAGAGAAGNTTNQQNASAFVAELQFPSVEEMVVATTLGTEHRGLMHDQALMPFIQQLSQASLRSFQSMPNGDFYAFFPDYFGEFAQPGQPDAYWDIRDIEILEGGINLTDDALATHVFAIGDNTWPLGSFGQDTEFINMLFSAGSINIFNAFLQTSDQILADPKDNPFDATGDLKKKFSGMQSVMGADEAVNFIKRYGARPLVKDYPMVRSNLFEMLLAYQQFMFAWSNQFQTPFKFTFMPEVYPGGRVSFSDHGFKMYVKSVTHSWDYQEGGFTTDAQLVAPSLMAKIDKSKFPDLPNAMVRAMVEPIGGEGVIDVAAGAAEGAAQTNVGTYLTNVF